MTSIVFANFSPHVELSNITCYIASILSDLRLGNQVTTTRYRLMMTGGGMNIFLGLMPCLGVILVTSSFPDVLARDQPLNIDVRFIVDKRAIDNWEKTSSGKRNSIQTLMSSYHRELSEIFETLPGFNVDFRVTETSYLTEEMDYRHNNGKFESLQNALETSSRWAVVNPGRKTPDLTILFTGYKFSSAINGAAPRETACGSFGFGIVVFDGVMTDVLAAAHEIGHILGFKHDDGKCSKNSDYYVMSSGQTPDKKAFYFSECSANDMRDFYHNHTCLHTSSGSRPYGPRLGSLLTMDDICSNKKGTDYIHLRDNYNHDPCVTVACNNPGHGSRLTDAPQGINCGKNKQCIRGECVRTREGNSSVSDSCPFGNQLKLNRHGDVCDTLPPEKCPKPECCQYCGGINVNPKTPNPRPTLDPDHDSLTADEVCQEKFPGTQMYFDRVYDSLEVCSNVICYMPRHEVNGVIIDRNSQSVSGADLFKYDMRLSCGENKVCVQGECLIKSSHQPVQPDTCAFGDTPFIADTDRGIGVNITSCSNIASNRECAGFERQCCKTCY